MHNIQDLFIANDIVPIFDYTLNDDAKVLLKKIMLSPLSSVEDIINRQSYLKAILLQDNLIEAYHYRKVDYLEAQRFLIHFSEEEVKKIDYLTYFFQKKRSDTLFGLYSQLIYFFKDLEDAIKRNVTIATFPKDLKTDVQFIVDYLHDFNPATYKKQIAKGKFGFRSIQRLNELVLEKRRNGDTLLFFNKLNLFEVYISLAKAIRKLELNFVEIGDSDLTLSQMYHPLVHNAVKNDLSISNNVVLLTGANMSGKSTLLKTIGLCVYLAHLGFPIPAMSGTIPFYNHIFIQINHSDDLKNGYSHFMNEIVNLKTVVTEADNGQRCFAVFDELFKGTNYEDALAISKITIKGLQRFQNSLFFISTHLNELQLEIEKQSIDALFVDCSIENELPIFSYKIKKGWSDLKIGQLLFKKVGLGQLFE
ncbi:MutS-related protein [Sphingobacterium rhinopitheci]|uniref:MutS-related protein n=1 Tax=Sphingobacterium rhinopitheci TaxID=2781960 RepID=UPI001F5255AD|nr:hypothetical protein [Sphingobacterium rhinopitheci]MCI0922210.1 hypothetical protein [Sphingobacterium rhinopitheci]